ncbi:MAG: fused MFS/spermidine synthase [Alphaproteobacteria bacterium]|nr:fused MFS/spermidine synthase [Alphaproteobacteria bacterium]MCB9794365.1 fused MFS/spermidine synthase [Alphaproteobacteria bacterium]
MDELNALRREKAIRALVPLFFVSGATGLVYQTIWARELQLVFGTSQFAIATVLSAFMAGLAVGGFVMARHADRLTKPLMTYGLIEVVIGLYALIFPLLVDLATPIYLSFYREAEPGPVAYGLVQCLILGVLLLLPTSGMGATLPLLGRFVTTRVGAAGDRVGLLYGVNTFGAVVGTWAAGFMLLPAYGLQATTLMAAAANLTLGAAAILLSRHHEEGGEAPPVERDVDSGDVDLTPVLLVAGLTGFASLIYEVSWFRLMGLMLGASTYAFSVMLLAFLIGIATGGWGGGRFADRALARHGPKGPLIGLALLQLGIALLSYAMMYLYHEIPLGFVALYELVEDTPELLWPAKVLLATAVMTPPALLMGATFPFLVRAAVSGDDDALGAPVGKVYGANTLGSIFGAFMGGFVLLPVLNVVGTVRTAGGANIAAALVAYTAAMVVSGGVRRSRQALAIVGAFALLIGSTVYPPPWNPMWMTAGFYKYVSSVADRSREGLWRFAVEEYALLFYDEGLSTVVTVAQSRSTGNIWLANNGKVDASTTVDMPTQVLVAHLPFLYAEDVNDALVIGLASGITLGALTLHDDVERIDVVELEPAIVQASHFFDDHNHRPLDDPRVQLFANDGRNHLLLEAPGTYDLIVSEPSNPWISGVSNLFTQDFFRMGKERLKPGGVWSQWVQLYGMDAEDLRSLMATFASVYPHVSVFATIEDADLVMVGSDKPLDLSVAGAQRLLDKPAVAAELKLIDVDSPHDVLTYFHFDQDVIAHFAGDVGLNTDDNMRVEFNAPRHLHGDTSVENFFLLLPEIKTAEIEGVADNVELARAYGEREEWVRALLCLKRVAQLDPGNFEAAELTAEYRAALEAELAEDEDE